MSNNVTPENGKKFTASEKLHIRNAEKIAKKLQKHYQEVEALMREAGSNQFLVLKGLAVTCNVETEQVANRLVMSLDCKISLPIELVN